MNNSDLEEMLRQLERLFASHRSKEKEARLGLEDRIKHLESLKGEQNVDSPVLIILALAVLVVALSEGKE